MTKEYTTNQTKHKNRIRNCWIQWFLLSETYRCNYSSTIKSI